MDRGQTFGAVLGLVALLSAFLLPLSSIAEGPGGSVDSFLAMFKLFITTLPAIQRVGLTQLTELAYIYMAAFVLIVIAGIIGGYPKWSAVLGIISIAAVTLSPFAIFTSYNFGTSNYGVGFWAIWATSILAIYAAYWSRKERKMMKSAKSPEGGAPATPSPPQSTGAVS
ncbi:MAG: hypothetical protein OK436_05640 [Thaumarchaeota archaeon]|nr:hypothetical protein [Nitrososphaerota archaeon]